MPAEAIFKLADPTAIAVRGRLKVTLIKPQVKPVVGYDSKLIEPKQLVNVLAMDDDEFEAEGELIIEISY